MTAVHRLARGCSLALLAGLFVVGAVHAQTVSYHLEAGGNADLALRFSEGQIGILEKLNRADRRALPRLRQLVVPDQWPDDERALSPMPRRYGAIGHLSKALIVSLPDQVFGAYERGDLVRWGPISSGADGRTTPPGLYHLNWRATGHVSSVNPDWFMPWYFNFDNAHGHAFHEYDLPGTPASHGCVRLLQRDAQWLYEWGDEWQLDAGGAVLTPGTTVVLFGSYRFGAPPPWRAPTALNPPVQLPPAVVEK